MHRTDPIQRCETCRYWVQVRSTRGAPLALADAERGYCHAAEPQPAGMRWAETRFTEWCGKWTMEPPRTDNAAST